MVHLTTQRNANCSMSAPSIRFWCENVLLVSATLVAISSTRCTKTLTTFTHNHHSEPPSISAIAAPY